MKIIYYNIAGHTISIETSDAAATAGILPSFVPFRIAQPTDDIRLFHLSGNMPLEIPQQTPEDDFDWNGISYTVYGTPEGRLITMTLGNKTHILRASPDWRLLQTDMLLTESVETQFLNNFLIVAFGMASAPMQTIKVHASVIEKNGNALLFLGKSGTGKSTHSSLWQRFIPGCSLLNDDEPVVRVAEDGSVWVYGTPWSGKTPCYRNEKARVAAFVQLYQAPENRLSSLAPLHAFGYLFGSSCMMRTDADSKGFVFNTVADILQNTPVYRLDCRPDEAAVRLTEQLMNGYLQQSPQNNCL